MLQKKDLKSNAGRKPFDVILKFKILILHSLYNLSDGQAEYQARDRLFFMRFLNFSLGDAVSYAKTLWLFREELSEAGLIKKIFERFDTLLCENGFAARKGQIIDASIVQAPRQRNSREENKQILEDKLPEE